MWRFSWKGESGFNGHSTAEQVTQGIDGSGLTAVVTGSSSGIGAETTRVLVTRGVHVIMAVRNVVAGSEVRDAIIKEFPSAKVDVMELDLASMASVRKFATEFTARNIPLNILINNAGHFLLTHLLLENMKDTSRNSNIEGRIVNVSSEGHKLTYREGIRFNRINDQSGFIGMLAYGQSKLANILHANELSRRFKEEGVDITANSVHPGFIYTNLFRNHGVWNAIIRTIGQLVAKNVHQGAATTCFVALHPRVKGVAGKYFSDSNVCEPSAKAKDTELAKKLWDFTMDLVA